MFLSGTAGKNEISSNENYFFGLTKQLYFADH